MFRYMLQLSVGLAIYATALVISLKVLQAGVADPALQIALALLPLAGVAFIVWVIVRQIQQLDELQRRVQLEALAFAFAATAFMSMAYGFLENVGFPKLPTFAIWPAMATLWVIGVMIGRWRYR